MAALLAALMVRKSCLLPEAKAVGSVFLLSVSDCQVVKYETAGGDLVVGVCDEPGL